MSNPEGFSSENSGSANAAALQKAVDCGGTVIIDIPGKYYLADTVYLKSGSSLIFGGGVEIIRQSCSGFNGNAFINRGAFTGETDKDISVKGLTLRVNGVESAPASEECKKTIVGLRGHLAFLYVENLTLENITVTGLADKDYGIQICNFRNVSVDTVYIEGRKDGIHFGPGKDFVLKNGVFRTGDDPVALNADDYSVSNPTLGDIENGLIENCRDLKEDKNDGFFARILSGAWGSWFKGMKVRQSDSVIHNGKLYRVVMTPSWEEYESVTPPDFEEGFRTLDGIRWAKTGYEAPYSACVKNITFRNISLEKPRSAAVAFWVEQNEYRRGLYPGAVLPSNGSFVFDNVRVLADIEYSVIVFTPVESITIRNSVFGGGKMLISEESQAGPLHPDPELILENNDFE